MRTALLLLAVLGLSGCAGADLPTHPGLSGCHVVGDSIASERGLGEQFPGCHVNARVGAPSWEIISLASVADGSFVIVSAGTNDAANPALKSNLIAIHDAIHAEQIVWVLPADWQARVTVEMVASIHGDATVGFVGAPHPDSYVNLASDIRKVIK